MAYTDELSTSGYLYPKQLLDKNNIKPSNRMFVKKHDEVVRLVYEGEVDAGATFYSPPAASGEIRNARARLKTKYPDVEKKVVTIVKAEAIPNDPNIDLPHFQLPVAEALFYAHIRISTFINYPELQPGGKIN